MGEIGPCWVCGGGGEVECDDCDLGVDMDGDTCRTCSGDYEAVMCDDCEGNGYTEEGNLNEDDWRKPR